MQSTALRMAAKLNSSPEGNMPLPSPFKLRDPEDACDAKLLDDVASHGWHVVQVFEDSGAPQFAFTVGLYYQFLQPEVLIMGLDLTISAKILNGIGEAIRKDNHTGPLWWFH